MKEASIQRQILVELSHGDVRLFRNNCGVLQDKKGQYVRYGLTIGSSDLIGWKSVTITPEMVGRKIAQFVAIEVKRPLGKVTPEQENFINTVNQFGGLATVCYSTAEALNAIKA